jgi:Zn-dependent protease/CBS domain-containing protein
MDHMPGLSTLPATSPGDDARCVRQSFRFGRFAGIDLGVHWSVVVIAVLLAFGLADSVLPATARGYTTGSYVAAGLILSVAFLVCLLGHELAHALLARHYGIGVPRITLWLLGGVSELDGEPPTPGAEFVIAAAGPGASLVIGGTAAVVAAATGAAGLVGVCLVWLAGVNLILGVFNLLPGAPLDGGRVLHAALWRLRGDRVRAQIAADRAGVVVGLILATIGLVEILFADNLSGLWLVLLAWFLISAANADRADTRMHSALDGLHVRDIMATDPVCGYDGQTVDQFVDTVAAGARHRAFPVIDLDRAVVGVVHLADLLRVPPEERGARRLRAVVRPATVVLSPDLPAADAVAALSAWSPLAPVATDGRLIGTVSAEDVRRAIDLARLRPRLVSNS